MGQIILIGLNFLDIYPVINVQLGIKSIEFVYRIQTLEGRCDVRVEQLYRS